MSDKRNSLTSRQIGNRLKVCVQVYDCYFHTFVACQCLQSLMYSMGVFVSSLTGQLQHTETYSFPNPKPVHRPPVWVRVVSFKSPRSKVIVSRNRGQAGPSQGGPACHQLLHLQLFGCKNSWDWQSAKIILFKVLLVMSPTLGVGALCQPKMYRKHFKAQIQTLLMGDKKQCKTLENNNWSKRRCYIVSQEGVCLCFTLHLSQLRFSKTISIHQFTASSHQHPYFKQFTPTPARWYLSILSFRWLFHHVTTNSMLNESGQTWKETADSLVC